MALFALLLFAACGDDDDDDGGDGNGDATSTPDGDTNQPDEGDDEDDEQGDAPSGDDADYVAHICTSMGEFVDELIAIGTDPANQDATEEEQLELSREPFAALVDAMENADPPGDIEEYHDQLVEGFREVLERIEDGDVAAFETDPFEELPEPPAAVAEKYEALANQVPECASTGVFGEE
jgi:hypothetical protein